MSGLVSPEYDAQIRDTIRDVRGGKRRTREADVVNPMPTPSKFPSLAVILDENLDAVTNPLQPTSALARLCKWSVADSQYSEVAPQIRVWNHSFTGYVQHTLGAAVNIDGHHWFFGDCVAMDSGDRATFE